VLSVGVLEPGRVNGGIRRYGEVVAQALGSDGVVCVEVAITPSRRGRAAIRDALRIVGAMRGTDAVILPYTRSNIWSPDATRLVQLGIVHLGLRRRTITVMHDAYRPGGPNRTEWWVMSLLMALSGRVILHSEAERRQLRLVPWARRAKVIPHFVFERPPLDRARARSHFGVSEQTQVVAMVGWMNPRKNYELAVEALSLLPQSTELWLIGGAGLGLDWYQGRVEELARARGVAARVTITGSVPEGELEQRLAAVDVGLCPYQRISASGSLSTFLGARRPVIATDVEFVRELSDLAPGVVHRLERLDPAALADSIKLALRRPGEATAFEPILRQRSLAATSERYRREIGALVL
jgi:glycosyltransferase involved in cell wall biosynthesis